jgi:hypothetical protein
MATKVTRNDVLALDVKRRDCLREYCAKSVIHFRGQPLKGPEAVSKFEGHIALLNEIEEARTKWLQLVADEKAMAPEMAELGKVCGAFVTNAFGEGSDAYRAYGLASQKRATPTLETRLLAKERRLATRKARGTLGKVQREGIHGEVDGSAPHAVAPSPPPITVTAPSPSPAPVIAPVVSPVTAPVAPIASPAPVITTVPAPTNAAPSGALNGANGAASSGYGTGAANGSG